MAEKNVLGCIMLLPDVCDEVALLLRPDDFYDDAHRILYEHMIALHENGRRIDATLLIDRLKTASQYDIVGGSATIGEIATSVPTAANATYYANIVSEKATLRALIQSGTDIVRDAYDSADAPRDVLNRAEQHLFGILDDRATGGIAEINDVLVEAFERIDARLEHGGATGIATGYTDLDAKTGGLHEGEMVIIAARPSMGKTAFAANITENVAIDSGEPVLFVSLEMSRLELVQRMMCSRGEIAGEKFRTGFLSGDDRKQLIKASSELSKSPIFIDDSPTRNVTEIAAGARRLKRKQGLSLIVVDYLQLIQPDDPRDPRQEQVAKIARRLKVLARELSVPMICLAQLNRQAEMTKDNRPKLSHLRESGAIEQDADVVMMVHREEYYLSPEEKEAIRAEGDPDGKLGEAEIIIAKQRNGPTGDIKLHWFQQFTRFTNAVHQKYDEFSDFAADEF